MHNLLCDPVIRTQPIGALTLPGVLAALSRDEITSYPSMRPHQGMFWHMFCVQLATMALKAHGNIPKDEYTWRDLLRAMTPDHTDDAPWSLVVDDWTKPAFMQAAVPDGCVLKGAVPTPDALDMLITAKNHDLKQAVSVQAAPEDWLFALVTLQTGEGYGGRGNQGIVRMNGGNSSRALVGLAPLVDSRSEMPRPGAWFDHDVRILRDQSTEHHAFGFKANGGLGLTWLAPWCGDNQLQFSDLDWLFIEICRRVRLLCEDGSIVARRGNSKATRVNGKHFNGAVGDPWAPVHRTDNKSLTIGEDGDFDYRRIMDLVVSGNWDLPLLAKLSGSETKESQLLLVTQALARGNSKTGGFRSRTIPIAGKVAAAFGSDGTRQELHEICREQAEVITTFRRALGYALVIAVAGGDHDRLKRDNYDYAKAAQSTLDRYADTIFFPFLWRRFEKKDSDAKGDFIRKLWHKTRTIFEHTLPAIPCGSLVRPKAETRARGALYGRVMKTYSDFLKAEKSHFHV